MSRLAPVGRRRLGQIEAGLSDRDRSIMRSVASLRLISAKQLEALHFAEHATPLSAARSCRRVLERLATLRVLARLDRRVGGVRAGSAGFVYRLGPVGDRLVRAGRPRHRAAEPSLTFVDHTLAVAQVAVDLSSAARTGDFELLTLEVEPACWREIPTPFARPEMLKPDLFVAVGVGDYEYRRFVEVDRGTEHLPAIKRKCAAYERYYRAGEEQHRHGVFPKVIWSVPDATRARLVLSALPRADGGEALFAVTTSAELVSVLCGGEA